MFMSSIFNSRTSSLSAHGEVRIDLDAEVIHALERLMVFLAEYHLAFRRIELHAFHHRNQLLGVGGLGFFNRRYSGHCCSKTACGEEVGRRVEALLMFGDEASR